MRGELRALVGMMLVGWCCIPAAAEDGGSRWWPFGGRSDEQPSHAAPSFDDYDEVPETADDADDAERRWMFQSRRTKVSWPRLQVPEVQKPALPRPRLAPQNPPLNQSRNAWMDEPPRPAHPAPLQAMSNGARRVREGTRAAWDKTVDVLTPGASADSSSARVAQRPTQPPLWKRMFGAGEAQRQGPQTITEWMAQDRPDR